MRAQALYESAILVNLANNQPIRGRRPWIGTVTVDATPCPCTFRAEKPLRLQAAAPPALASTDWNRRIPPHAAQPPASRRGL